MEAAGFVYSDILTKEVRAKALQDKQRTDLVSANKKAKCTMLVSTCGPA
jgi:hypothetical protein